MKSFDKGQILLILLLVMVVALAISLSIIQRSLADLSNATKVEQSSRAFSAAEAGIEQALRLKSDPPDIDLGNSSGASVDANVQFPRAGESLEYPPLAKEDIAHVWLADYTRTSDPLPPKSYTPLSLNVYWGNSTSTGDKAALELTVTYYDNGSYGTKKWFFDPDPLRAGTNKFTFPSSPSGSCSGVTPITTNLSKPSGGDRSFKCKVKVDLKNDPPMLSLSSNAYLILLRGRLLYNTTSQPFAVEPVLTGCSGSGCDIPYQASIFTSTGTSGETRRKVQVFQINKVVPFYFDFAIFSAGEISK